jgi:lambda family phage portal protein
MFSWLKSFRKRRQQRSFTAAIASRLTGDWSTAAFPADYDIRNGFTALLARVRDLAKNNDYVKRYLGVSRANIIGPKGIVVQSRVPSTTGNDVDDLASTAIEQAWQRWGRYGTPDVTGKHSWVSLQNCFITDVMRDGEALYRVVKGWGNGYGYALQRLDVMNLPVDYKDTYEGRDVVMGVELDEYERPIAYHMQQHKPGKNTYYRNGTDYLRIPANEIIHRFLPEFVHQTRGFSPMSSAMLRLKMLGGYEEAAVTAARVGASTMGFFTRSEDGAGYPTESTNPDGSLEMGVEPGLLKELPAGVGFSEFDPKQPHGEYADFVKATLRGIASGLGVNYNTLANDLEGVNFSSIRAGVLEDREAWKCLQEWVIDCFVRPVYEEWVIMAIMSGAITIGGRPPASDPSRYTAANYQGRRWSWVDPLKDAQAAQLLINERLTTRSNVIRDMGLDPDEVWRQAQTEEQMLESMGIAPKETANETQGQADPNV